MRIRTQFSKYSYALTEGETNIMPSETIPNQALSIHEVLVRYGQGRTEESRTPIYFESMIPDLQRMDLVDIDRIAMDLSEDIKEKETSINDLIATKRAERIEAMRVAEKELEDFRKFKDSLKDKSS